MLSVQSVVNNLRASLAGAGRHCLPRITRIERKGKTVKRKHLDERQPDIRAIRVIRGKQSS